MLPSLIESGSCRHALCHCKPLLRDGRLRSRARRSCFAGRACPPRPPTRHRRPHTSQRSLSGFVSCARQGRAGGQELGPPRQRACEELARGGGDRYHLAQALPPECAGYSPRGGGVGALLVACNGMGGNRRLLHLGSTGPADVGSGMRADWIVRLEGRRPWHCSVIICRFGDGGVMFDLFLLFTSSFRVCSQVIIRCKKMCGPGTGAGYF